MFERLITGHAEAICTIAAFAVAASIFVAVAWRAVRMDRAKAGRFAHLPFETPTPEHHRHEPTQSKTRD